VNADSMAQRAVLEADIGLFPRVADDMAVSVIRILFHLGLLESQRPFWRTEQPLFFIA